MRFSIKRNIVLAALAVVTAWPIAHHFVTQAYGMNHWRFFGWSMYCKPSPIPTVNVYTLDDREQVPLSYIGGRMRGGAHALEYFFRRRRLWGDLYEPDQLAAAILGQTPSLRGVRIYVNTIEFDPWKAAGAYRTSLYECRRGEDGCTAIYEAVRH